MNQHKVALAVESICNTGCNSVYAIIELLETGNKAEGFEDFSEAEIIALKNELKAIMDVYNNRD